MEEHERSCTFIMSLLPACTGVATGSEESVGEGSGTTAGVALSDTRDVGHEAHAVALLFVDEL